MRILAVQSLDMQRQPGVHGEGLEPFLEQFRIHVADLWPAEINLPDEVRPAGYVDSGPRERFVHRNIRRPEAADSAAIAERARDRLPDDYADILDRVMHVYMQVALGADLEVDHRVPGEGLQHVIEEADAGLDVV